MSSRECNWSSPYTQRTHLINTISLIINLKKKIDWGCELIFPEKINTRDP